MHYTRLTAILTPSPRAKSAICPTKILDLRVFYKGNAHAWERPRPHPLRRLERRDIALQVEILPGVLEDQAGILSQVVQCCIESVAWLPFAQPGNVLG